MISYQEFIAQRADLFWSVSPQKKDQIGEVLLVETILNYGSLSDVTALFELLGIKKVATIFFEHTQNNPRHNYLLPVENFFRLYFNRHVSLHSL